MTMDGDENRSKPICLSWFLSSLLAFLSSLQQTLHFDYRSFFLGLKDRKVMFYSTLGNFAFCYLLLITTFHEMVKVLLSSCF